MNTSFTVPHNSLLPGDVADLQSAKWERQVRDMVSNVLKGTGIKPVYIDFSLVHPLLRRFGFGHAENRQVTLALRKGDTIESDTLQKLDIEIHEWAGQQTPTLVVNPVRTKRAGWLSKINGFVQNHGHRSH